MAAPWPAAVEFRRRIAVADARGDSADLRGSCAGRPSPRRPTASTSRPVLELGPGTGETALRVLAHHPDARWTGIACEPRRCSPARASGCRTPICARRASRTRCRTARSTSSSPSSRSTISTETPSAICSRESRSSHDGFVLGDVVVPERPEDTVIVIDSVRRHPHLVHHPGATQLARGAGVDDGHARSERTSRQH